MPNVPAPRGLDVTPTALPEARVSPNAPLSAFGGGQAADGVNLSGLQRTVTQIAQEERNKADQLAVLDADNQLSAYQQHQLYGSPDDPQAGVLNRRGKDAFSAPEEVEGDWDQTVGQIAQGLGNDTQRLAFQRMAAGRKYDVMEMVQRHVAAQRQTYDNETTTAARANALNEGLANASDPARVDFAIQKQHAIIADYAQRNGLSPDWVQQQTAEATSRTRMGVLEQLVNTRQDLAAQQYLTDHRADFVAADLADAERLTARGSILGESQRQSDQILTSATTLDAGLKAAAGITDPNVREDVERRIRSHFEDVATAERQQREDALVGVQNALRTNGGDVNAVPVSLLSKLTPEQLSSVMSTADRIRHPKRYTDPEAYHTLSNMAGIDPQAFSRVDLTQYRGQLDDADYKRFENLQREQATHARDQAAKEAAKRAKEAAADAKGRALLRGMGVNLPPAAGGAPSPAPAPSPTVPGAPITKPPSAAKSAPAGLNLGPVSSASGVRGLRAPLDYVRYGLAENPDYLVYLDHMGALG